mgnify:CR=1 FL=1
MEDYNRIPSQQFANIIKRYIQHRKATELQDRIQSETFDNETRSVMERMNSFYERVQFPRTLLFLTLLHLIFSVRERSVIVYRAFDNIVQH